MPLVWAGSFLALASCSRGCEHNRPYTPYAIEPSDALPGNPAGSTALMAAVRDGGASLALELDGGGGFPHVKGELPLDPAGTTWMLAGMRLAAPSGEHFVLGLPADFDGDGVSDAVTWVASQDPAAGRLLFFKGRAGGTEPANTKVLASFTDGRLKASAVAALASSGCPIQVGLEMVGPHTVATSVDAVCTVAPPNPGAPVRWIGIFGPAADAPVREQVLVGLPAEGEQLWLDVDASDRDGDGRDDLVVSFALDGAPIPFEPGPRMTAELRWLDRPAGLSRDEQEPETSLRGVVAGFANRAGKVADAADVAAQVRGVRRLYDLLCGNAGSPAVSFSEGPIRCSPSRALEDAAAAEVRSALASGDVARAAFAYARIDWQPATSARRAELKKALEKAAPVQTAPLVRLLSAVPDPGPKGAPDWGPLMFDPAGELLVRTQRGIVRARLDTAEESTWQGMPTWPASVASSDDRIRWLDVIEPCRGGVLHARFGVAGDPAGGREVPLPLLAPAPGHCSALGAREPLRDGEARGIGWGPRGLDAAAFGQRMLIAPDLTRASALGYVDPVEEPAHAGSPRSADGNYFAWGTPLGVLIQGPPQAVVASSSKKKGGSPQVASFRWLRPGDLEGEEAYRDLSSCVVANGGGAAACIRRGRVIGMSGTPAQ